ncbi:MAG: ABC transporter permease [Firmicutes bacterium]|nr:ABC transporter permease [Bacillota bacterium]
MNPGTAAFADEFRRVWYRLKRSSTSLLGLGLVFMVIVTAVFAPWMAPYPEDVGRGVKFWQAHQPPSSEHPFGTDHIGRDILSRLMFGARISLMLGFVVLGIAIAIGVPLGLVAGLWGGWVNTVIMRLTDIFLAIPPTLLALAVASALSYNLTNAMFAIAFGWWPWFTRLVQGEVLKVKEEVFVEASRSLGASKWRIAFKEVLPNVLSPLIVKATLDMGFVILIGASLSFLGLGAQPPTPAWGTMIAEGRLYLPDSWWIATFPGLAIFITVLGFNLLGDGLRDVFDVDLDRWN